VKKRASDGAARAAVASLLLFATLPTPRPGAAPPRPRILGVSHITLYVHDMESARNFYAHVLGYGEPLDLEQADFGSPSTFIRISDRQFLELVPEREAGSDRLAKIAVETDNAEAMRSYLNARRIAVPERLTRDRLGNSTVTVIDPDGHVVEFVQYLRRAWTARDHVTFSAANALSADMRHIGILVGGLEPAIAFYRDVLGFKEIWRGSRDEKELNWVNMQVPDGNDYIEFMLYRDLPEPSKRGSQHHICLFVPDIERALSVLRVRAAAAGYTRAMEIRTGTNRKRQLNLYDPDGTRTELMEPTTVDGKPAPSSTAPPPRDEN
jgi:lactoylglutathione lyase